jgi:hypothetical protein
MSTAGKSVSVDAKSAVRRARAMPDRGMSGTDDKLRAAVREATNRRFIEAWFGWRGAGRLLPDRASMTIADIAPLLDTVMIFAVTAPNQINVKVAGARLRDIADFEATGRSLSELTPPALWPIRRYRMMHMATSPCAGAMTTFDRHTIASGVTFETVTLPVASDGPGQPSLLISNIAAIGGAFEAPAPDRPRLVPMADRFEFVDIGAGTPERTEP